MDKTRSKYNVDKNTETRTYDGVVYDSQKEMEFYRDWVQPKITAGEIVRCDRQVRFELLPGFVRSGKKILPIIYTADYVLQYENGREQVIDIKGCPDSVALLKRKMFWYRYPDVDYIWLSYSKKDGGWVEYEVIKKRRAKEKKEKRRIRNEDDYCKSDECICQVS